MISSPLPEKNSRGQGRTLKSTLNVPSSGSEDPKVPRTKTSTTRKIDWSLMESKENVSGQNKTRKCQQFGSDNPPAYFEKSVFAGKTKPCTIDWIKSDECKPLKQNVNIKKNNKSRRKDPRGASRRGSGVNRKAQNNSLVASELAKWDQEVQGTMDAVREMTEEVLEAVIEVKCQDAPTGGSDSDPDGSSSGPHTASDEVGGDITDEDLFPSPEEGALDLRGLAWAHFQSHGYSWKSLRLAYGRIPMWLQLLNIKDVQTEANVKKHYEVVYGVYCEYNTMYSWLSDALSTFRYQRAKFLYKFLYYFVLWFPVLFTIVTRPRKAIGWFLPPLIDWLSKKWNERHSLVVTEYKTIEDWCCGAFVPYENTPKMWIRFATNWVSNRMKCEPTQFRVGITLSPCNVWIPRLCLHNMWRALTKRQLLAPLSSANQRRIKWQYCYEALQEIFPCPDYSSRSFEEAWNLWFEHLDGKRKKIFSTIKKEIEDNGAVVTARTKAFPKREVLTYKKVEKRDPRCISGKTPDYLAETAPHYYCMVKDLIKEYWADVTTSVQTALKHHVVYTSGMTPDEIGALVTVFEQKGWYAYEGDFSRYDAHNEIEALEAEFEWYNIEDRTLSLLKQQLRTRGSAAGITFAHVGKVASGVINTSFGNTLRGFMVFAGFMKHKGIKDWVVIQLGDDNVLLTGTEIAVDELVEWCLKLGHKLEMVARPDYDYLEYCSGRFWDVGGTRVLGPKVGRACDKTYVSADPLLKAEQVASYMQQVAIGQKHYFWVPIFGYMSRKIANIKIRKRARVEENPYKWNLRHQIDVDPVTVSAQFYKIYGFDASLMEDALYHWIPQPGTCLDHPLLRRCLEVDGAGEPW